MQSIERSPFRDISSVLSKGRIFKFGAESVSTAIKMSFARIVFYWMLAVMCGRDIVEGILPSRKLIVISFDAFKPVYLEKNITPFIESLYEEGVRATNMNNTFPTKTFVNHFSIETGETIYFNLKI